jgi:hypothetical protein
MRFDERGVKTPQFICLLLLTLLGCKSEGLPADPLFTNGKPLESKAKAGPPVDVPFSEPTPPVQRFVFSPR